MCTVTLSYDKENKEAIRQLSLLLATGLFTQMPEEDEQEDEFPGLDYSDPDLWKKDEESLPLPKGKETFTPEEALDMIINDIEDACHAQNMHNDK